MKIIKVKEVNPRPKKRSEIAGKFESNEKHINNKTTTTTTKRIWVAGQ